VTADGKCATPGAVSCFCKDGQLSGSQICSADGTLSSCVCTDSQPTTGGAGTSGTTTGVAMPSTAGLCKQLKNLSNCKASSYAATALPASVLFLLDRSGSMACNLPPLQSSTDCEANAAPTDPKMPTKWQITKDALKQVFSDMNKQGSTASVGMTFFSTNDACGADSLPVVAVAPLTSQQVTSLGASLDAIQPNGETPIVGASSLAYAYLHQEANKTSSCAEPCGAHGNRFVVLMTDGTDSCPMPARSQDAAACTAAGSCSKLLLTKTAPEALAANIRTFVIGSPGSELARGFLSELAVAGGTARSTTCVHDVAGNKGDCHFDMTMSPQTFAADLGAALSKISGAALACEFAVPNTGVPVREAEVNVQYSQGGKGEPVCLGKDAAKPCDGGANGWQFKKSADGTNDLTRVVLCGQACTMVRADAAAKVDVIRGCNSIVVQ
jgi:hypothetical protein